MSDRVVVVRHIARPAEQVWRLCTTSKGLARWWWPMFPDCRYEIDARELHGYRFHSASGNVGVSGDYFVVEPLRALEFSWVWDEPDPVTDHVRVVLAPDQHGTTVTLTHTITEPSSALHAQYVEEWTEAINRLAALDDHHQLVAVLGRGVVPASSPLLTADDLGLTRGDGVFDATRVVTSPRGSSRAEHLDRHLDRFGSSLTGMGASFSDYDRRAWRILVDQALTAWHLPGEAILKLLWTRGLESSPGEPTQLLTITPISAKALADREGVAAALLTRGTPSDVHEQAPWLLGGVKNLSYAVNMAAKREAVRRGASEVIFTSTDGYCLEGPNAALLVWDGQVLSTTPAGVTGILPSITQAIIFEKAAAEGVETATRLIRPEELFEARGVWLASSIRGTAPVVRLDDRDLATDLEFTARMRGWIGFGS